MAASLSDGIRKIVVGIRLVALGDMPAVTVDSLRQLDQTMRAARRDDVAVIVQPRYRGESGHPVGFGRDFFAELITLTGDRGARAVVARHANAVIGVELDDPGVLLDFDQPPG
ncbi:MAG: NTP transferase domain-containing protein [Gammaproteobacteria bacterium]|nr:NTP transferase domain-containing protein [Gammaproteobacteria bacterium]